MNRYAIEIFYSTEDEGYISTVPELPGCSAFGTTEEIALEEVKIAIDLWIDTAREEGREIPEPQPKRYSSRLTENDWENIEAYVALKRLNDPNDKVVPMEKVKEMLGL
jgi:predicted RNase H-like HicB family nuclease